MRKSVVVSIVLSVMVVAVCSGFARDIREMPSARPVGRISALEIAEELRDVFSNATSALGGTRYYPAGREGMYDVVPFEQFERAADWYYKNVMTRGAPHHVAMGLVGFFSTAGGWKQVPVGFVGVPEELGEDYAIFVTREGRDIVVYKTYYSFQKGEPVYEKVEVDCDVRLVVLGGGA